MQADQRRTGRVDTIVWCCEKCGWESAPHPKGTVCVNRCGNCGKWGLLFTRWEAGVEDEAARAAIDALKPIPKIVTDPHIGRRY